MSAGEWAIGLVGVIISQTVVSWPLWYALRAVMRGNGASNPRNWTVDLTFVCLMLALTVIWGATHPSLFGDNSTDELSITLPFAYFLGSVITFFGKLVLNPVMTFPPEAPAS